MMAPQTEGVAVEQKLHQQNNHYKVAPSCDGSHTISLSLLNLLSSSTGSADPSSLPDMQSASEFGMKAMVSDGVYHWISNKYFITHKPSLISCS